MIVNSPNISSPELLTDSAKIFPNQTLSSAITATSDIPVLASSARNIEFFLEQKRNKKIKKRRKKRKEEEEENENEKVERTKCRGMLRERSERGEDKGEEGVVVHEERGWIRHGRCSDRKVRVVGQVNDIRVYIHSYIAGTLGNELTGAFRVQHSGEGSSRACRSARAFVRLTLNTSFTA